MKINKTVLIFSGIILAIVILFGFIYFNQQKENLLLRQMISEKGSAGKNKKDEDPYLANEVKNRVLKGYGEMNKCYKEYLAKNPKIKDGNIVVDWQIDTNGKTVSPEIVTSDFRNPEFEHAVINAVTGWKFPEPVLKKYVTHTFKFKMEKKGEK
jgi:TonB family protein